MTDRGSYSDQLEALNTTTRDLLFAVQRWRLLYLGMLITQVAMFVALAGMLITLWLMSCGVLDGLG